MRNRAKCKLCGSILESFHEFDWVECTCKEIAISGGQVRFECAAKDWSNFLRIDDAGIEKPIQIQNKDKIKQIAPQVQESHLSSLSLYIDYFKNMPEIAMTSYATNFDLLVLAETLMKVLTKIQDQKVSDDPS